MGRQRTRHVVHLLLLEQHRLLLGAHVLDAMAARAADAWRHTCSHHRGRVDVWSSWARDAHLCSKVLGDGAGLAGLTRVMSHAGGQAWMSLGDARMLLHRAWVW